MLWIFTKEDSLDDGAPLVLLGARCFRLRDGKCSQVLSIHPERPTVTREDGDLPEPLRHVGRPQLLRHVRDDVEEAALCRFGEGVVDEGG